MIDPVVIDFQARGITETGRAFDLVERRLAQMERTSERTAKRTQDAQQRANRKVADEAARTERQVSRFKESEERRRDRLAQQSAEKARVRAMSTAKLEEEAERGTTRVIERELERRNRIRMRSSEMAGRIASQQAATEIRATERATLARGRMGTRIARGVGRTLGGVGAMAAGALAIGGGFALASAARNEASDEQTAALIVNAVTTGGAPPPEASVKNILGRASQVSRELGMNRGDIAQAGLAYARSARGGDIKGLLGNMGFFAKMAMVTGTDISEIAGAAGKLQSQNPDLGGENQAAMQQMLLNAYAQSKAGSVSMSEAAAQFGTLGSTRGMFQGNEARNQQVLLGLGQIAASGGNVGDIGTYIKDVSMEAAAHLRKGEAKQWLRGVKTDKFGRFESPEQLIEQVFRNTGGDLGKIHEVFGNRGVPLFTELQGSFVRAGGGEAGIKAVHEQITGTTQATMTAENLDQQVAVMVQQPGKRLEVAFNRLEDAAKTGITPALEHLADRLPEWMPAIDKAIEAVMKFADFLIEDPVKGVGLVIGAAFVKEIAAAQIGNIFKGALTAQFAAGLNIATATLVVGSLMNAVGSSETGSVVQRAQADVERIQGKGTVSGADVAKIQGDAQALRARKAELEHEIANPTGPLGSTVARGARAIVDPVAGMLGLDTFKKQLETVTKTLESVERAGKNAAAGMNAAGTAAGQTGPTSSLPLPARALPGHG